LTVHIPVPDGEDLSVEHLALDVNGTLSDRGEPITAALSALERIGEHLQLHLLTADTFGTAAAFAASLRCEFTRSSQWRTSTATSSRSERTGASPSATGATTAEAPRRRARDRRDRTRRTAH
jgi:hypothetical protein